MLLCARPITYSWCSLPRHCNLSTTSCCSQNDLPSTVLLPANNIKVYITLPATHSASHGIYTRALSVTVTALPRKWASDFVALRAEYLLASHKNY